MISSYPSVLSSSDPLSLQARKIITIGAMRLDLFLGCAKTTSHSARLMAHASSLFLIISHVKNYFPLMVSFKCKCKQSELI